MSSPGSSLSSIDPFDDADEVLEPPLDWLLAPSELLDDKLLAEDDCEDEALELDAPLAEEDFPDETLLTDDAFEDEELELDAPLAEEDFDDEALELDTPLADDDFDEEALELDTPLSDDDFDEAFELDKPLAEDFDEEALELDAPLAEEDFDEETSLADDDALELDALEAEEDFDDDVELAGWLDSSGDGLWSEGGAADEPLAGTDALWDLFWATSEAALGAVEAEFDLLPAVLWAPGVEICIEGSNDIAESNLGSLVSLRVFVVILLTDAEK